MTANDVRPFMFPAHTTHCLQPVDKSFFKSLTNNWTNEGLEAVRKTGGRSLGKPGFLSVFHSCLDKVLHSGNSSYSHISAKNVTPEIISA